MSPFIEALKRQFKLDKIKIEKLERLKNEKKITEEEYNEIILQP
ncbi:hypothetical protein [Clostridium sp.]|jgi:hypothetical protein